MTSITKTTTTTRNKRNMVSRLLALLLVVTLCVGLIPMNANAEGETEGDTLVYLALGDSITYGLTVDNIETEAFVYLVAEAIGATTIYNEGTSGLTTAGLCTALDDGNGTYDEKIAAADVITITIGGNDLMALFYAFTAELYNSSISAQLTATYGQSISVTPLNAAAVSSIFSTENDYEYTVTVLNGDIEGSVSVSDLITLLNSADYGQTLTSDSTFQAAVSTYVANVNSVVEYIRKINSDVQILIANQYNAYLWLDSDIPDDYKDSYGCSNIIALFDAGISYYNTLLSNKKTDDYTIIDVYTAFNDYYKDNPDIENRLTNMYVSLTITQTGDLNVNYSFDFHPLPKGHALIASLFEDELLPEITFSSSLAEGETFTVYDSSLNEVDLVAVLSGGSIDLSEYTAYCEGYYFAGWYSDAELTNRVYYISSVSANTVLYAKFLKRDGYLALGDNITSGDGLMDGDDSIVSFVTALGEQIGLEGVNKGTERQTSEALLKSVSNGDYNDAIETADVISITVGTFELREAFYEQIAKFYNAENDDNLDADDIELMIHDPGYNVGVLEKAQILLEMLNTNDYRSLVLASTDFNNAIETCADNITSIVAEIRKINSDAVVLVTNQYNPYQWITDCENIADLFAVGAAELNKLIAKNSSSAGYEVVDICTLFAASESTLTNADVDLATLKLEFDFLPNEAGHQVIAEAMADAYAAAKKEYVFEIPVEVTTVKGGSADTARQTFELEILDYEGNVMDTEDDITVVTDMVNTDGADTYSGTLKFAVDDEGYAINTLLDGFFVRLKSGNEAGWTYDDKLYYIYHFEGEDLIFAVEDGWAFDWMNSDIDDYIDETTSVASFTCTYTAYTLSFVTDINESESGSAIDSIEVVAGKAISLSEYKPTDAKYTFTGWYTDDTLQTPVTDITLNMDTTVYASWTLLEIEVDSADTYLVLGDGMGNEDALDDGDIYPDQFAEGIGAQTVVNTASENYESLEALREYVKSGVLDEYIAMANVISIGGSQQDAMYAFYAAAAEIFNANKQASLAEITADDVKAIIDELNESAEEESGGVFTLLTAIANSNSNLGKAYDLFVVLNGEDYSSALSQLSVFTAAADTYAEYINDITEYIKEKNPDTVILVNNLYDPYQWLSGCDNLSSLCSSSVDYFNSTLAANQSGDYTIVDVNSEFKNSAENLTKANVDLSVLSFSMDYYPLSAGQEAIAIAMLKAYKSAGTADEDTYYTLTFETNGGTDVSVDGISVSSVSVLEGTEVALSGYTTTRDGYTFTGWYTDSDFTNLVTSITMTADTTLYAGWQANSSGTTEPTEVPTTEEQNNTEGNTETENTETENTETETTETENTETEGTETENTETENTETETTEPETSANEKNQGDAEDDTGTPNSGGSSSGSGTSPKTGDAAVLWIWMILMMCGVWVCGTARSTRRRK